MKRSIKCSIMQVPNPSDPIADNMTVSVRIKRYTEKSPISLTVTASVPVPEGMTAPLSAVEKAIAKIIEFLMDHRHDL